MKYLVKEGMEQRLREFCMRFWGPVPGVVLGFKGQALLKEFLAVIAGNAKLQRLYTVSFVMLQTVVLENSDDVMLTSM